MKISDILVREASILDLESTAKDDLLAEMASSLAAAEPALEAGALLGVLREREALQSTGIGEGVAIPHGKVKGLARLVAYLGPYIFWGTVGAIMAGVLVLRGWVS